jgi:hypothetical protein
VLINGTNNPAAVTNGYYFFISIMSDQTIHVIFKEITITPTTIALDLKVFLEGVTINSGGTVVMTDNAQNPLYEYKPWYPNFILPETDPYLGTTTYSQINNPAGTAGQLVDWILVEIWGNITVVNAYQSQYDVLETQALLLKPDGTIVDVNGNTPQFEPQTGTVHIAIKHRSHVTVLSNPISDFSTSMSYNFSAAGQAYKHDIYDSDPMIQKYGVYCMYAGDILDSGSVDTDSKNAFQYYYNIVTEDGYFSADLNMDGTVDADDMTLIQLNFKNGAYSPVVYFQKRP